MAIKSRLGEKVLYFAQFGETEILRVHRLVGYDPVWTVPLSLRVVVHVQTSSHALEAGKEPLCSVPRLTGTEEGLHGCQGGLGASFFPPAREERVRWDNIQTATFLHVAVDAVELSGDRCVEVQGSRLKFTEPSFLSPEITNSFLSSS